jgi:hypothetical protein
MSRTTVLTLTLTATFEVPDPLVLGPPEVPKYVWSGADGLAVPMPTLPEVVMAAKVAVPDNAGLAESTTDPVPVEVVVPVPPRATASVPDPALSMFRAVIPEPAPVKVEALTVLDPAMAP